MERDILSELKIDKELVKKRFARSVKTYGEYAVVQKRMAKNLLEKLISTTDHRTYNRIFDIGCGDGALTELILKQLQPNELIANDIVKGFKPHIVTMAKGYPETKTEFIAGDIETTPLPDDLDLITSNAVFQWINHLDAFYMRLAKEMKDSAIIAFTSFGTNTLPEIKQLTNQSLNYLAFDEHCLLLKKYFKIVSAHEETDTRYFESPKEVLKHLKQMGVNAIRTQRWKRADLENFSSEYIKRFSSNNKVSLTYNPLYFILEAK